MKKIALYPGMFDPMTYGHVDLVKRASDLFERVVVAVADNARKTPYFSVEERFRMANEVLKVFNNTEALTIPHPGLINRKFVFLPLLQIAPDLHLPNGERLADLIFLKNASYGL